MCKSIKSTSEYGARPAGQNRCERRRRIPIRARCAVRRNARERVFVQFDDDGFQDVGQMRAELHAGRAAIVLSPQFFARGGDLFREPR